MDDQALVLDRYRLVERLASGGSAEVWRARDEQLNRAVAVKRLHPHLLPDEASRKRLVAEARAAAGLSHPVIVGIYDVDASGESPALVMELVDGESLSTRLERDGPLPPREAAVIVADLAEALYHAHQRGVIHRDVKPGNVLLGVDGRTRLVDFGIAHSLAESAERLTLTGTVIGTLRAMAPEQLAGGPITPRTDLYGLGVVLHEALTGRPPYPASSPVALADAQRSGPPALDGVDPALASIVAACLSYDAANRPLHAGALAAALRDWLAGDPAGALAMAPAAAPADSEAVTRAMPVVAPAAVASGVVMRRSRWRAWLLAASVGIIGLVVLGAVIASGIGPTDEAVAAPSSAVPTASPLPTPTVAPAWLAELGEKVEKDCGEDLAAQAVADMAALTEDQAKAYADELVEACKGEDRNGGGGNGRGGGNGGSGRGGGD